jgi:hypothetical protein
VQDEPLVQGGPQRPVHAILEVQLTAPPDDVREQVTVERRVLGQQLLQIKRILGGDELIEANGTGRDLSPFPGSAGMIGIGPPVPDLLKDHHSSLVEDLVPPLARDDRAPGPGPRADHHSCHPRNICHRAGTTLRSSPAVILTAARSGGLTRYGGEFS